MAYVDESDREPPGVFFSVKGDGDAFEEKIDNQEYRNRLDAIVSDAERSSSEKLQAILQLGTEWFDVEHGHLVRIDPAKGTHTIAEVSGPHPKIKRGATAALSSTYCRKVIAANGALAVQNAPEQGWNGDPAYEEFALATYLGAKVVVSEELYGTVCFVDEEPRVDPFEEADAAALALIVRAVGQELERSRHEDRLRRTRARLEALFEDSPDMIHIHDGRGNLIVPNPRLCEKTGYNEEELARMKVWDLVQGLTPETGRALWQEMDPGERHRWERVYQCKDGSTFPVEVDIRCLDLEGEDRFVTTSRDITDRKKRERTLRREKDRFESLVQEVEEYAIFLLDPEGRIQSWNDGARRIKGYREEEILGESLSTFYTEDDREQGVPEANLERAASEGSLQDEGWRVRKDRSRFWADVTITALYEDDGTLRGFSKVTRDMTERRERERELERVHELFVEAEQLGGLGAWEVDPSGTATWTEGTRRIHEVGPDFTPTVEKGLEFVHPDDRDVVKQAVYEALDEQAAYDVEARLVTAQENERWVHMRGQSLDEEETRVRGFIQDITRRKEAEEELKETKARYESLVEDVFSTSPIGAFILDADLEVVWINETVEAFFGIAREDVIGADKRQLVRTTIAEIFEDGERFQENVFAAYEDNTYDDRFECHILPGAEHEERWLQHESQPIHRGRYKGGRVEVYMDITERKEREQELRDQGRRLRQIRENVTDVLWMSPADKSAIEFVSDSYEDIWGRPIEELEDQPNAVVDAIHAEDRERVQVALELQREDPEAYEETYRIVRPDGEVRWVHDKAAGVYDDNGELERIVGVATDITERKRAEEALREERDLLNRILETSPSAVVHFNREGEFIRASGKAKEVLGLERDEVTDRTFNDPEWKITAPDGSPMPEDELPFARVMATGEPVYEVEHAIEWPDGTRRLLSVSGAPLQASDGSIEGAVFHIDDITESRKAERALKERQEKVAALYRATSQLLRAENRDEVGQSILQLVNEVFGYPIVAVRFIEDGQFVPVSVSPEIPEHMPERPPFDVDGESVVAEAFRRGDTLMCDDLRTFDDPHDYGAVRATAVVPMGDHGTISVADLKIGTIDDFDRHLIEVLSTYAALVLDRLEHEHALVEAKEEAEEAARLKATMLANMSHEIRTPLTSVTGFSEALRDNLDGQMETFAEKILYSGERLQKTLNSVLQLSELEAGTKKLPREPVRLDAVAEDVVELFRREAADVGVQLTVDPTAVQGEWHEAALTRITENLVENAIKFTPDGGQIEVRVCQEGNTGMLEVEDTGVGIREASIPAIFEAFKQESEGLDREFEGSGLGLPIVKRLTEALDGTVDVESEKGEGTCFTVRLPCGTD